MRLLARTIFILGLLCSAVIVASAQAAQSIGTSSITGRVMVGDKPAQGVMVVLIPASVYGPERKPAGRATTDADGQFRLTNIAAGRYQVMPIAPTLVLPEGATSFREQGQNVNLIEGDTIEGLDFKLVRGGVITGRVTDAEGRPVIGETVRLALAGRSNASVAQGGHINEWRGNFSNPYMHQTDDRGVYRIYGVPADRYLVSVGEDTKGGTTRTGFGRSRFYKRTFHPGVADVTKAGVVEVSEGGEATNVDITMGRPGVTYSVSGRIVEAETGKPATNVSIGFGSLFENERQMSGYTIGTRPDAEGRFRIEGLLPGRYAIFAVSADRNEFYSVPVPFELSDADVTGVVVKVRRGASISGTVVIEGTNDRSVLAKLSQLRIGFWPESETLSAPAFGEGERVNPDGSFLIRGLRPGRVRLMLGGWPPMKGFTLLRLEHNGVEQRNSVVEVTAGAETTNVRLVLEYGSGVVRGQVRFENGTLPGGARLYVTARRPSRSEDSLPGVEVDARGRFLMEGLPSGEYELRLDGDFNQGGQPIRATTQNVHVTNGTETQVTIVVDLNAKGSATD